MGPGVLGTSLGLCGTGITLYLGSSVTRNAVACGCANNVIKHEVTHRTAHKSPFIHDGDSYVNNQVHLVRRVLTRDDRCVQCSVHVDRDDPIRSSGRRDIGDMMTSVLQGFIEAVLRGWRDWGVHGRDPNFVISVVYT